MKVLSYSFNCPYFPNLQESCYKKFSIFSNGLQIRGSSTQLEIGMLNQILMPRRFDACTKTKKHKDRQDKSYVLATSNKDKQVYLPT